jgi:hypothetical protein
VAPEAAWAEADYGLSITESRIRVGQTFHVTVSIDDDGGIDRNTTMCPCQALSDRPAVRHGGGTGVSAGVAIRVSGAARR